MKLADLFLLGLINILGFIQGILLGLFFIFNAKRNTAHPILGTFLIAYCADLGLVMLESAGYLESHPSLKFLPFRFFLLFMPLLYLYLKAKTHQLNWGKDIKHLIPGMMEFGVLTLLFFFASYEQNTWIENGILSNFEVLHVLIAAVVIIAYSVVILKYLSSHQQKLVHYFSSLDGKTLHWIKWMVYYIIIDAVLIPVLSLGFPKELVMVRSVLSYLNVLFIFWVAFMGFRQMFVYMPSKDLEKGEDREKSKTRPANDVVEEAFQRLLTFMEEKEPFTNENLTLGQLSKQLNISKRQLSTLINDKSGKNFNQFINEYRVEKAKIVLSDSKYDYLNMLGVAFQVGFSSKSSFYLIFKKLTGKTPANYQKSSRS